MLAQVARELGLLAAAGLAVLSRMGVNTSAGWQLATACDYNSANLSVRQITLDAGSTQIARAARC